jgi:hypothetical protein
VTLRRSKGDQGGQGRREGHPLRLAGGALPRPLARCVARVGRHHRGANLPLHRPAWRHPRWGSRRSECCPDRPADGGVCGSRRDDRGGSFAACWVRDDGREAREEPRLDHGVAAPVARQFTLSSPTARCCLGSGTCRSGSRARGQGVTRGRDPHAPRRHRETREPRTISPMRTVFHTSTAFERTLRALTLFMISS